MYETILFLVNITSSYHKMKGTYIHSQIILDFLCTTDKQSICCIMVVYVYPNDANYVVLFNRMNIYAYHNIVPIIFGDFNNIYGIYLSK